MSAEAAASSTSAACKPGFLGRDRASRCAAQPDDHIDAAVFEVERLRAALIAVAEDRDALAGERRQVDVGVAQQLHGRSLRASPPSSASARSVASSSSGSRKRGQSAGGWCANQVYWRLA